MPFPADRAASYRAAGYWTGRTLDTILADAAQRWPDRIAVSRRRRPPGHGGLSYAELDERADRAAAGLRGARHRARRPGTAAAAEQLPVRGGAVRAVAGGGDPGDVPTRPPRRRAGTLRRRQPGHRTGDRRYRKRIRLPGDGARPCRRITPRCGTSSSTATRGHSSRGRNCATRTSAWSPAPPADPGSPALLLVSGGTTGTPKLIPRTHDDYVFNATASAEVCRLRADDVYLVVLSAGHNFPLACPGLLGAMTVGATTVFGTDPSPEAAFAAIARHGVTVTALVPALAKLWAQACDWEPVTPKSLRLLQVGGAKLEPDDARRMRDRLDPGPAAGVRDGGGSAELHPARRSAGTGRPHPGAATVRRRRTAHRRQRRRAGRDRRRR